MMKDSTKGLLLVVGLSLGMGPMGWLAPPPQLWAQAQEAPFAKDYKGLDEAFEKLLNFEIPFEPAKAPLPPAKNASNGAGAVANAADDAAPSQAKEPPRAWFRPIPWQTSSAVPFHQAPLSAPPRLIAGPQRQTFSLPGLSVIPPSPWTALPPILGIPWAPLW